jgi:signal transduction histidine kinase
MSEKTIRILLVEDDAGDARWLREMLNGLASCKCDLTHRESMEKAVTHLLANTVDIVLLDLGLPGANGLDAVRQVHAIAADIPIVVLTGLDDELLAAQALQEGAQDYLIKGQIEPHALLRSLRYAIERQRMQAEKNEIKKLQLQLKDDFLSHVSHELRSPLTAIYQFVTILADGLAGETKPEQHEYLQIILRNVRQLQSMIDDLLEATRAQAGKLNVEPQCACVSDAIVYAVSTLQGSATAKDITLSFDLSTHVPSAYADPTRLRQILIILFDNAIKFTPHGGAVKAQARVLEKDPSFLLVEVSDSGCGINPDMTERIFERLYQVAAPALAARKGLGLGLYICKELVMRQGGQIWVQSPPGQGAIFSFTLPVFSLGSLIAPLLSNEAWPADSVALMSVEIGSQDGWLSKERREEWSRESRMVIQRCLLPNLDVLLPKMDSGGAGEVFFVVVFANDKGAGVLAKRIREQFGHLEQLKQAGLTFSVSFKFLSPTPTDVTAPLEDTVGKMAARIEDLIKSESLARSIHHE